MDTHTLFMKPVPRETSKPPLIFEIPRSPLDHQLTSLLATVLLVIGMVVGKWLKNFFRGFKDVNYVVMWYLEAGWKWRGF